MEWSFKWHEALTSGIYFEQLVPRGFIKPEDAEPNLGPLDFYVEAFFELSTCRPSGLELQAIPFTAIIEYSNIFEIEDTEEFAYLMRLIDRNFLRLSRAEKGKNGNVGNKTNSNNSR